MKTRIIFGLVVLRLVVVAFYYGQRDTTRSSLVGTDPKNTSYMIGGKPVQLVDGKAEISAAPGSASQEVVKYFGNELRKDLDGDGREDVAFLITQSTGGSGTFFYLVGALARDNGYVGTHAVLIGDRIAPQTTNSWSGRQIVVNYADRKPGEPMTARPSQGKSLYLLLDVDSLQFGEVVQNFEGEADPSRMNLMTNPEWRFQSAQYNDGTNVVLKNKERYSLSFKKDGTFTATTDCNSIGGTYTATNASIEIKGIYSTKMYCEGSNEDKFIKLLQQFQIYHFTSKGELIFDLMYDTGVAIFR